MGNGEWGRRKKEWGRCKREWGRCKKIYIVRFLVICILRLIRWIYLTMAQLRSKSDLPSKICLVCHRPFSWRKKWADCWDNVKYCSERCRRRRSQAQT